jgi:hypothetical protein
MSDAWDDEGFGGDDDWAGGGDLEGDAEDDALSGLGGDLDDPELAAVELEDDDEDDTLTDEEP